MRTFLLLLLLSAPAILQAQPKATYGGDVALPAASGLQYGHAKVAVSPTGVIYVARMRSSSSGIGYRWQIVRSTDGGKTFSSWKEGLPLANGHYTAMDFRGVTHSGGIFGLYLATADVFEDGSGSPLPNGANVHLTLFDTAGTATDLALPASEFTPTSSLRGWTSLSMADDGRDANPSNLPFSFALAASKQGSADSVIVWTFDWTSSTGVGFKRSYVGSSPGFIRTVSAAMGSNPSSGFGQLAVVWDEVASDADQYGQVYVRYVFPDDGLGYAGGGPHLVASGIGRRPSVALSLNKAAGAPADIRTVIFSEISTGGELRTQSVEANVPIGGTPSFSAAYSSVTGVSSWPYVAYDPTADRFCATLHRNTPDGGQLPYYVKDQGTAPGASPTPAVLNYRDATPTLSDPQPHLCLDGAGKAYFVWTDNGITMFDSELAMPSAIGDLSAPVAAELTVYPNPARETATISFRAAAAGEVRVVLYDAAGRVVTSVTTTTTTAGLVAIGLNLTGLSAGTYMASLQGAVVRGAVPLVVAR